jgi:hypothetical protein
LILFELLPPPPAITTLTQSELVVDKRFVDLKARWKTIDHSKK